MNARHVPDGPTLVVHLLGWGVAFAAVALLEPYPEHGLDLLGFGVALIIVTALCLHMDARNHRRRNRKD